MEERNFGRSSTLLPSAVEAIGNTPLVELRRLLNSSSSSSSSSSGRILAKLEFLSPGHSKKDRVARQIIEDAEAEGILIPGSGQTVVELTSGNTGTGLAIVCACRGYKFVAIMSKGCLGARARMMSALGAEVILVEQSPNSVVGQVSGADIDLIRKKCEEVVLERNAFRADQFNLLGSVRAHELHTGPEIWQQSLGQVDLFVDFLGSGGTFFGVSSFLKKKNPNIKCFIVEPVSSAILSKGRDETGLDGKHKIQGGGYMMSRDDLSFYDASLVDGFIQITDEEAIITSRRLASEEGLFAGFSAGANVAAALQLLKQPEHQNKIVACLLCDSGLKYLSTDLWASVEK